MAWTPFRHEDEDQGRHFASHQHGLRVRFDFNMVKTHRLNQHLASRFGSFRLRALPFCVFVLAMAALAAPINGQIVPGSMDVRWNAGSEDCKGNSDPPVQVHRYELSTLILRQNLCVSFEGNFLYLLIGSQKALLIDTGAVADASKMPVAKTVLELLPSVGDAKTPLLVVHTHGHTDHRDGDAQFTSLPGVEVAPFDVDGVQKFFGFKAWPNGTTRIDLGGRIVDVFPAPGHHRAHLVFYDERTALLFTGDFLLPGRLLVEDTEADKASAARVIAFVRDRPVSHVLGAHIEKDENGELFDWGSTYHPREHRLELTKDDLLQLPGALDAFNGVYTRRGNFVMMNQNRVLAAEAGALLVFLMLVVWGIVWLLQRCRRRKQAGVPVGS